MRSTLRNGAALGLLSLAYGACGAPGEGTPEPLSSDQPRPPAAAPDEPAAQALNLPPGLETQAPLDDPLVDLASVDPRLVLHLSYGTEDNFVGEVLYPEPRALLRASAAARLVEVLDRLEPRGLGLLVYDAYRPHAVQRRMWELLPNPDYVADPARGSRHNRGMAVDVGLCDGAGTPLEMPTAHDAFEPAAAADAVLPWGTARRNRDLLIEAMAASGFKVLRSEWWHFDAEGWEGRALLDVPIEAVPEQGGPKRAAPDEADPERADSSPQ